MSEFDPPPPPPSSVPPPPPGPPGGGFQPPAGGFQPPGGGFQQPGYPLAPTYAPVGPAPSKGPNKGLIAAIIAAVAVIGGVIAIVATRGDGSEKTTVTVPIPTARQTVSVPDITVPDVTLPDITFPDVTLPDITFPDITLPEITLPEITFPGIPDITVPNAPPVSTGTIVAATDGNAYVNDNGWTMQIPSSWTEIPDASAKGAQAAWYTGKGDSTFGDNVSVQGISTAPDLTTQEFLDQVVGEVKSSYPDAVIESLSVITTDSGVEYGRLVFTFTTEGVDGPVKTMLTNRKTASQWLITDFTAKVATFDGELPDVEPYIASLTG